MEGIIIGTCLFLNNTIIQSQTLLSPLHFSPNWGVSDISYFHDVLCVFSTHTHKRLLV